MTSSELRYISDGIIELIQWRESADSRIKARKIQKLIDSRAALLVKNSGTECHHCLAKVKIADMYSVWRNTHR